LKFVDLKKASLTSQGLELLGVGVDLDSSHVLPLEFQLSQLISQGLMIITIHKSIVSLIDE
jgi:hypothetical protein